jgi:hypothetical protein
MGMAFVNDMADQYNSDSTRFTIAKPIRVQYRPQESLDESRERFFA